MKNYKTRRHGFNQETEIQSILESRLMLQSVQRYLDECKIKAKNLNYFKSREFLEKHFSKWTAFQKKVFLEKLVGNHWKHLQKMIEKE